MRRRGRSHRSPGGRAETRLWSAFWVLLVMMTFGARVSAQGVESTEDAPPPPRDARLEWDVTRRWLYMSLSFRDVVDASLLQKMRLGLPTTIIVTGLLYAHGEEQPLASSLQNCKITWHVWEEMYRVEIQRPNHRGVKRHWTPTLNGVLRRCAQVDGLLVADSSQVRGDVPLVFRGKILVNPVSPETLRKIQRWISHPSNTSAASPGSILFSTFTGLFMTRIGEAERVLEIATRPVRPSRQPAPSTSEAR